MGTTSVFRFLYSKENKEDSTSAHHTCDLPSRTKHRISLTLKSEHYMVYSYGHGRRVNIISTSANTMRSIIILY